MLLEQNLDMLWKLYFWIFTILSIIGLFALLPNAPFGIVDFIGLVLNFVLILAMYAYVYQKTFLSKKQWKIIFWLMIFFLVEELAELYFLPKDFVANLFPFLKSTITFNPGERLFSWLISLPGVYAAYKLSK